jgi:hypothetical protein
MIETNLYSILKKSDAILKNEDLENNRKGLADYLPEAKRIRN